MIKRLGVSALRLEMYIQRMELLRQSSTTLRDGFLLTTSAQITTIHRVGIKHVWIDELKGVRAVNASPAPGSARSPHRPRAMTARVSTAHWKTRAKSV